MKSYSKPSLGTTAAYGRVRLCVEMPAKKDEIEERIEKLCEQVSGWIEEGTLEEHVVFELDSDFTFDIIQGKETELDAYGHNVEYADTVHADADVDIFDYAAVEEAGITSLLQNGA